MTGSKRTQHFFISFAYFKDIGRHKGKVCSFSFQVGHFAGGASVVVNSECYSSSAFYLSLTYSLCSGKPLVICWERAFLHTGDVRVTDQCQEMSSYIRGSYIRGSPNSRHIPNIKTLSALPLSHSEWTFRRSE